MNVASFLYSEEALRFIEDIPDPVTKTLVNMAFVQLVKKSHLEKRGLSKKRFRPAVFSDCPEGFLHRKGGDRSHLGGGKGGSLV